jgi:hypothetical protein
MRGIMEPLEQFSKEQIAAIFTEWLRRYQDEPGIYWASLLGTAPLTYGEMSTEYFLSIHKELHGS